VLIALLLWKRKAKREYKESKYGYIFKEVKTSIEML